MEAIKVFVVSAFEPLRAGLVEAITAAGIKVIDQAPDLLYALKSPALREADVFVVDSDVVLGTRAGSYERLGPWLPRLNVLFLGTQQDAFALNPDNVRPYLQLNAVGFVYKDGPTSRVIDGIRLLAAGNFVCETELIRHILLRLQEWTNYTDYAGPGQLLSDREKEVLTLLVAGGSNKDIARKLFLSEGTVKAHVSHIMTKLNIQRRAGLVRYALSKGIVQVPDEAGEPFAEPQP